MSSDIFYVCSRACLLMKVINHLFARCAHVRNCQFSFERDRAGCLTVRGDCQGKHLIVTGQVLFIVQGGSFCRIPLLSQRLQF